MNKINITQLPGENNCPWHKQNQDGKLYKDIFGSTCPILWHTLYPYFLGFVFGAKYGLNEKGDCNVCCPAELGIDLIVRVRPWDKRMPKWVPQTWRDVIHAEVVNVRGYCAHKHHVGERIVFPTCDKESHPCPAGIYNMFHMFPMLRPDIYILPCIDLNRMRCPDWADNVYYSVE